MILISNESRCDVVEKSPGWDKVLIPPRTGVQWFESTPALSTMRSNSNQKAKVRGPRQNLRNRNGSARRSRVEDPAIRMRPSYPGQPTLEIWVPGTPEVLSTTVTTGVIAEVTTLSNALLPSFSTRFAAWVDHRITKYRVKVTNFSSTNPGLLNHWFDEESSNPPSSSNAISAKAKRFGASVVGTKTIEFTVRDPTQLNYSPLATSTTVGYYKMYTNNADFGSSIVASQYCLKEVEALCQFRGFI